MCNMENISHNRTAWLREQKPDASIRWTQLWWTHQPSCKDHTAEEGFNHLFRWKFLIVLHSSSGWWFSIPTSPPANNNDNIHKIKKLCVINDLKAVWLTLTVFGVHSISIVTRLTQLTVLPCCVAKAMHTFPSEGITVSCLADVCIPITLTADTGPTYYLWVTIETTSTPGKTT